MKTKNSAIIVALLASSVLSSAAFGATALGSLPVSANILSACSVGSVTSVAFGTYVPAAVSDATGVVSVTCSQPTPYNIGLDAGANAGQATPPSTRAMVTGVGVDYLSYELYQNAGRTTVWGNVSGSWSPTTGTFTGTGLAQTYTVYGRIPAGQFTSDVGSYNDTVAVTVFY